MSRDPNDTPGGPVRPEQPPRARAPRHVTRRSTRRAVAGIAGLALVTGAFATEIGPFAAGASSHREAPLIAGDPRADNTDVYAFVAPDAPGSVTLIANWIPFEEPNGGPNFYPWADDTRYNINIDNDGDALADYTYTWIFDTVVKNASQQFLVNTGPVTSLDDPDLNVYQTYDLTVTDGNGVTTALLGNGDGVHTPGDPIASPSFVGPASTPDYAALRNQATYSLAGGGRTYAGQADDPFFLDLRVFDLLYGADASEVGTDTLAGYNVNTIALQVPQAAVAIGGDATRNPVIGVWSTTERRSALVADAPGTNDDQWVQVSRLGNPLVNEVVIPLSLKDAFNSVRPDQDAGLQPVVDKVLDPILPGLIETIYGVPAPEPNRNDLFEIFLTGVSKANAGVDGDPAVVLNVDLNSQDLNMDAQTARGAGVAFRPSEMLRLNMSVPPAAAPDPYGVLAGDIAGFPNGRRLGDDVVDIAIQAVMGAAQTGQLVNGLLAVDSVDRNDVAFGNSFPYVALPQTDSVNNGTERTPRAPEFVSVTPERVLETRTGQPSGQLGYSGSKPSGGRTIEVQVTGTGTAMVPADAGTVFVNIAAVGTEANGFVTAFPCGTTRPTASTFNPVAGEITQNLAAVKVGANGRVCIYTSSSTDLLVDLVGYHPSTADFVSTAPERLLETRTSESGGQKGYTGAMPGAGQTITLDVTQVGSNAVPNDATAVFLNVTAANTTGAGWVTAYPCGSPRPNTSNVNLIPGVVRANLVPIKIGTNGTVCLFVSAGTDLVADLQGYAPAASTYVPTMPERVLETRAADGRINYSGAKPVGGQTVEVKVAGFGTTKIPADAGTVLLNLTVTESAADGFVTVHPCGTARPLASNINFTGRTTPNLVAADIGDGGRVCIYTSAETHLVADIVGYFPGTMLADS
ncbi:MAG: DUF4331 domain-containing protein [Acidimicrobiaceae bacterium]|nr:DUF4331 domain-containing protein [Acidimicrobiaceae bacterium]